MRWLLCFFLTSRLIAAPFENVGPSTPDEIASLSAHLLIDGYISPLSGQVLLQETDLLINAAQELTLKRVYVPPQILGRYEDKDHLDRLSLGKALLLQERRRWVILPHLWAGYNLNSPYFQVYDPSGFVLEFEICDAKGILKTSSYGFSNLRQEEPDSTADLRNIEFFVEQDAVRMIWPEGTERIYRKQSPTLYRLEIELLSNGKALHYEYNNQELSRILSTDKSGKHTYASITKSGDHAYIGSDGREAKFHYETFEVKAKAKLKKVKESISFRTPILTQASNPTYTNFIQYNERSLLSHYDAKEYPVSFEYFQQKDFVARVQRLNTPFGSVLFTYDLPIAGQKGGWTKAEYENGASVLYRFDQNLLLIAIENWHEGELVNQKIFSYTTKQQIQRIEIRDGVGNLLIAHTYECDSEGNALLEKIQGDFGTFSIKRAFTTKGRLIREERDDGLGTEYTYLESTRLLTSKTVLDWGKPIRKTTYLYDEANNLIKEAEEGQTYTKYILKTQEPHLHRVQWEEKRDWEGQLIHKIHFAYDEYGNCSKQEHFGSDGNLAYTIKRVFDVCGNLVQETNSLDQVASYQYDHRGRCIHEVPFSNKLSIDRTFDEKGRLTLLKEADHITCFTYNALDDLIEKTDYLGLKTNYTYHPVHHKPILMESPPTLLKITYDSFGREIQRSDAYEAKTTTKYNSYGNPIEIVNPDLGVEVYQYEPNGLLTLQIDPDGLKTAFTYDALGRTLSKTVGSYTTYLTYDAYHLIEQVDPEGIATYYKYNLAGQKTEETRADRTTKFFYDALGFLATKERSGRCISYVHDQMGQLLTKSIDGLLTTHWTYNSAGLVATSKRAETSFFTYDPYDRLIEIVDEEGAKTNITYDEKEQILVKTIRDPRNRETIETYNAYNLLLKREIPGSVSEEFEYDLALRLIRQGPLRFSYSPQGNQTSLTEEARTTFWTYTPGGKIQTKTKPDGTLLCYEYNSQGELIKVGSRQFLYDRLSRLIQGSGFSRTLDPFGNVLREEFSNGLVLESTYDDWNRPLERTLPDYSRIIYEYEGPYLRQVIRLNPQGSILYTHTYDQYNEVGLPLSETGLFQTTYTYDKTARRTSQINPYLNDTLIYDEAGNLMQRGFTVYTYDDASQLTSETNKFTAQYDQHYNCIEKNGKPQPVDSINQIQDLPYDANGNLLKPGFCFDVFDQLTQAAGENFVYDALGRRLQKGHTSYLYIDDEEIGSFESSQSQELKIPGYQNIVAIEMNNRPYAPVQDVQGTIRYLIDWKTKKIVQENTCDAFGMGLTEAIPYAYAGKRYNAKTNLIYFGKRYYDPELSRWLTRDPLGPIDHSNLYQYVFNNPFAYRDPTGEFALAIPLLVWGAELALPSLTAFVVPVAYTALTGVVAYASYKVSQVISEKSYHSGKLTPHWLTKSGSIDPTLPADPDELLKRPGWKETTHPDAGKNGHRSFENEKTGEKIRHDKGKPGYPGHKRHDHYHRPNPDTISREDKFLDAQGNPVPKNHDKSHIYSPDTVWWE